MKVKLDIKDGNSSHNDGVRYTVFEVKERSEFFDDFSSKKSPGYTVTTIYPGNFISMFVCLIFISRSF